jgi:hypothetical protein
MYIFFVYSSKINMVCFNGALSFSLYNKIVELVSASRSSLKYGFDIADIFVDNGIIAKNVF